jgi:DNA (cytosine-5)-methyltransferase 1
MGTGGNNVPLLMERHDCLGCFDVRLTSEGTRNARSNVYEADTSRTIDTGGNAPESNQGGIAVVFGICSKGSNAMKSDNPKSGFYEAETTRTLDANGGNPSCSQGGMCVVCLQGSMIGRSIENGPQGAGINKDVSFTLDSVDRHAVAYGIGRDAFNQGRNAKFGTQVFEEVQPSMLARGPGAVYCTSKNSFHTIAEKELASTLCASEFKDPPVVNVEKPIALSDRHGTLSANDGPKGPSSQMLGNPEENFVIEKPQYIVRRLTPTECARLQGFPDWWCDNLGTENPTEDEIAFWRDVFLTQAKAMGKAEKPKSDSQIRKWLKDPNSESAEYKMWGNGVSLPIVFYVLSGIVREADRNETGDVNV